jgi:predicted MFS family arabinose efflux permease
MADGMMDPRDVMRGRAMNLQQYGVVAICILINMIDGYDILALAQAGSTLRREWGMSDAALGTLLSMNLVGMALGALAVSPVADQWGRRPAMLICLTLMSLGMAISAVSNGFGVMALGRLITGVGIGGMTSTAGTMALEYANVRWREFATASVASAYPVGTIIGAIVAVAVLDTYGWRGIFWFGAGLSATLLPIAFLWLPESLDFLLTRQPKGALETTNKVLRRMDVPEIAALPPRPEDSSDKSTALSEIWQPVHRNELLFKLFIAHALNMFAWYFIINWGPPLVAEATGSDETGARYSAWVSYGGIVGGLAGGYLCGRIGVKRMMWVTMTSLAVLIALFGQFAGDTQALWIIAPLMGAALFGSAVANWLTIAYAFPPHLRATGLGFATTAGRVGSIFGPIVGGALLGTRDGPLDLGFVQLNLSLTVGSVCVIMGIPAILAALNYTRARRVEPGR